MKKNTSKAAALIIAMGKKPKSESGYGDSMSMENDSEQAEVDEGKLAAAEDLISALDNKDAEALVAALDAFMDCR